MSTVSKHNRRSTRREWFRSLGRWLGSAALAALGGALTSGRARLRDKETCINRGVCGGCGRFDDCSLPQALSAKEAGRNS